MATLTLGKSVTLGAVQSKKGDAVFVERRRRIVAPGSKELRDEPVTPTQHNAADDKLRAVLEAARAREEEQKKRQAEEAQARAAREAEIAREAAEYEQVKNQLNARENIATAENEPDGAETVLLMKTPAEVIAAAGRLSENAHAELYSFGNGYALAADVSLRGGSRSELLAAAVREYGRLLTDAPQSVLGGLCL